MCVPTLSTSRPYLITQTDLERQPWIVLKLMTFLIHSTTLTETIYRRWSMRIMSKMVLHSRILSSCVSCLDLLAVSLQTTNEPGTPALACIEAHDIHVHSTLIKEPMCRWWSVRSMPKKRKIIVPDKRCWKTQEINKIRDIPKWIKDADLSGLLSKSITKRPWKMNFYAMSNLNFGWRSVCSLLSALCCWPLCFAIRSSSAERSDHPTDSTSESSQWISFRCIYCRWQQE